MKLAKLLLIPVLIVFLASPAVAAEKGKGKDQGKKKSGPPALVIGKNIKVGMNLDQAITLLGIPKIILVKRGTEPVNDSITIEYQNRGLIIHAMAGKAQVEGIEVLPNFKGRFAEGFKIGAKFPDLIDKYGMPDSVKSHTASYPQKGMYFVLKEDVLVSAKVFKRNSRILDLQLLEN